MNDLWDNDPIKCELCNSTGVPHLHYYISDEGDDILNARRVGIVGDS